MRGGMALVGWKVLLSASYTSMAMDGLVTASRCAVKKESATEVGRRDSCRLVAAAGGIVECLSLDTARLHASRQKDSLG